MWKKTDTRQTRTEQIDASPRQEPSRKLQNYDIKRKDDLRQESKREMSRMLD